MKISTVIVAFAAIALGACVSTQPAVAPTKLVFVTRHLQKLPDGADPALSPQGAAAAERLSAALADRNVTAIYATPTRRAMETAAPLARRTGLAITPYDPRNPQPLVEAAAAASGAVLVVGHSNTVPDLVARFGARTPPPPMTEEDYGTVFVIDAEGGVDTFEVL